MFTGIVQAQCEIVAIEPDGGVVALTVDLGPLAEGLELGASVAHNGVCLTVTALDGTRARVDVIAETLSLTNLGRLGVGDLVNIERSMRYGDEIGGHVVSGHVSGTVTVAEIEVDDRNRTMWFDVDPAHQPFLIHKGFVALDGASLTISRVDREAGRIAVSLIPETLERTSLGRVEPGDLVNLEVEAQTQTIVHTVREILRDKDFRDQILASG